MLRIKLYCNTSKFLITATKYAQAIEVAEGPTNTVNVVTTGKVSWEEFDAQALQFNKIIKEMRKMLDGRPRNHHLKLLFPNLFAPSSRTHL